MYYGVSIVADTFIGLCAAMVLVTTAWAAHVYVLGAIAAGTWLVVLVWAFVRVGSVAVYLSDDAERIVLRHFWRDVEVDASEVTGVEIDAHYRRVPLVILERAAGRVRTRLLLPDHLDRWLYQTDADADTGEAPS